MTPRTVLLVLLALLTACQDPPGGVASSQPEQELERLRARVQQLEEDARANAPRAAAYRRLEFLGRVSAISGRSITFKILSTSKTPNPGKSDYPDCVVVSLCELCSEDGKPTGQRALVAMPVFHDRRLLPAARFRVGALIQSQVVPWDDLPDSVHSIQRIDETDVFDLPMFAAIAPEEQYDFDEVMPQQPDGQAPTVADAIQESIAAIEARLALHGTFADWYRELQPVRTELAEKLRASEGALELERKFLYRSNSYIDHRPSKEWPEPQIAYFTSLRDQLAAMGVDLIVAPFPEQELVVAGQFLEKPPADGVVSPYREEWHLRLLQAGIEVVDLRPALVDAIGDFPHVFYDAIDGHPANGGVVVAAREIAKRLRRYREVRVAHRKLRVRNIKHSIPRKYTKFPAYAHEHKCYEATVVMAADGTLLRRSVPTAPFLLVGDSFTGVPNGYGVRSANLGAHLTKETGVEFRLLEVGGSAPQLMVHMKRAGRKLTRATRALVYVFRENYMFRHKEDESKYRWQVEELPK